MEKECCTVRINETDKGYRLEIEGDEVKSKCAEMLKKCCTEGIMKTWRQSYCSSEK
jgi:hypothetical protein